MLRDLARSLTAAGARFAGLRNAFPGGRSNGSAVRADVRATKEYPGRLQASYAPVTPQPRPGTWRRTAASAALHTSMAIAIVAKNDIAPRYSRAQAPT
jgi:hypothetical protein